MADSLTPEARSRNMSKIRGKNTKPEMLVRKLLHAAGYRYRLHDKRLPGRPDLVFAGRHKVIFIHGCFWHMHTCKAGQTHPRTNAEFWLEKRQGNAARDAAQQHELEERGWQVLTLWECELRDRAALLEHVRGFLDDPQASSAAAPRNKASSTTPRGTIRDAG